jgi:hypothetical protein
VSIPTARGRPLLPSAVPDFNVKALRANAVLRWEFRLGSTLYLVWTQRRQDQAHPGDFSSAATRATCSERRRTMCCC